MPADFESTEAVTAKDCYRALSPAMAKALHDFCRVTKENPAAVIADALALHFDELDGALFDPTLIDLSDAAAAQL